MTTTPVPLPERPTPAGLPEKTFTEPVSEEVFNRVWIDPKGFAGLVQSVQNTPVGLRLIGLALFFLVIGGIFALLMRTQLAVANNTLLDPETYNRFMTMHGTTMMFLVAVPMIEGIATLVLPQMLGSRELPFPRLANFAFWTFLFGGLIFYGGFLVDAVPDSGWFAYVPLSDIEFSPDRGIDFWLLGLNVAEIAGIAGAFELIVSFFKMRAPGMTINRVPIFAWALMVTAWMILFAFTPLVVGSTLLELARALGMNFFNPNQNGDPLLWQHIFWFFGHPDVYIIFLPAVGMVATFVTVFARRALIGYNLIVASMVATGFLSFGLWVHHMFATGLPELSLTYFTAASMMIAIPSGIQVFAAIATIWTGRPVFKTPFLFILGFLVIFVLGGLSGVILASVPVNLQTHDTHFVVAHFHYVLIGGWLFPTVAGLYYWFPKFVERMPNERLGRWNFWLLFIGFNLTFFPMHISGLLGMPRRVYTYPSGMGLEPYNLLSTIGAFTIAVSFVIFVVNMVWSARSGPRAPANPWGADTLEWATPTPMPLYGFRTIPVIASRHPVWDGGADAPASPRTQKLIEGLENYPLHFRSQLTTSVIDAEPEEVYRVAGPSIWPFWTAAGLGVLTVLAVFSQYALAGGALVLTLLALAGWHRDAGAHSDPDAERAFEREFGVPLRPHGSLAVTRWSMILTIVTLSVALFTLAFSYFYLRLKPPQWPPEGIPAPDPVVPLIGLIVLVVGIVPMRIAARAVRRDDAAPLRNGLLLTALLGVVYIGINLFSYTQLGFDHQSQAFGSIFFTIAAFQMITSGIGVVITTITLFWFLRSQNRPEGRPARHEGVPILALFWYYLAAAGAVVYALLYLGPIVI